MPNGTGIFRSIWYLVYTDITKLLFNVYFYELVVIVCKYISEKLNVGLGNGASRI